MTDTTEMPEKIRADENGDWEEGHNVLRKDEAEYTRTNTIPSRAEVAREFLHRLVSENLAFNRAMERGEKILKEWEDAEK